MNVEPFKFVAVNSNLWYRNNHNITEDVTDPGGQFSWLENVLFDAREMSQKVTFSKNPAKI
jgi:hypothetical protein